MISAGWPFDVVNVHLSESSAMGSMLEILVWYDPCSCCKNVHSRQHLTNISGQDMFALAFEITSVCGCVALATRSSVFTIRSEWKDIVAWRV